MSDNNNHKPNTDNGPELTSLISNAIENKKILEQNHTEPQAEPEGKSWDDSPITEYNDGKTAQRTKQEQNRADAKPVNGQRPANSQKAANGQRPGNGRPAGQRPAGSRPSGQGRHTAQNRPSAQNGSRKAPPPPRTTAGKRTSSVNPVPDKDRALKSTAGEVSESTTQGAKPVKKGWSKKKKTGVAIAIIFIIFFLLLGFIVYMFFHYTGLLDRNTSEAKNYSKPTLNSSEFRDESDTFDKKSQEEELKAYLKRNSTKISDENVTNILLIGEDLRDTAEEERGNTDVMIIISLNNEQKTITMTSLMRDMYIYMSEYNYSYRLNAAYHAGGCEYLEQCIEDYFQIEIDRYVRVSFKEFITVVEALGGLDMTVTDDEAIGMHDPMAEQNKYLGNDRETDWLWEGGDLHLNGNQALAYARLRYVGNSDWERTERQRKVIKEIIAESKNLSLLQIDSLLNDVLPNVHTDLTDGEIASLLLDVFDYMDYDIQEVRIPADGYYSGQIVDNMDVLLFNYNANAAIIQKVVYGDCSTVEEAIEEYQNETGDFYAYNSTYDPSYNNNNNW